MRVFPYFQEQANNKHSIKVAQPIQCTVTGVSVDILVGLTHIHGFVNQTKTGIRYLLSGY